ncbi:hypothetical protein P170DRAFT_503100 [Aspergillus steynii IBT 23096]|uniref:Uncharacterized protein n=1 Tax=Aspergillus steynii IBT 23096 TaxID=1392250 RepID=A0A2I2FUT6_9EURO|nr:uncharacterized protein P170DRAFT_503100 [Aspergillus steynii IBT 23096]PLB44384.1 hypothetical protein P170DRAFT_503100 [Aspergillus steynii IBT 23096]
MDHTPLPSPAQIALAMAIVKHKPAGQDIKEYIMQIRQNIKSIKENAHSYPQERFFDSVSFWQKAYEKSEAEQSKLLDRIFELERRNEALAAKAQCQEPNSGKDEGASKRKTPAGKNPVGARKRAKTQVNAGDVRALESSSAIGGVGGQFEYVEEVSAPFMRQFYALQKTLQKRPSNVEISRCAVVLCKTLAKEMGSLSGQTRMTTAGGRSKKVPPQTKQPDIPATLHSVDCAFQLLCQALKKLAGSTPETGMTVYHIVVLYESTLNALEEECKAKTDQTPNDTTARGKKSKPKQGAKSKRSVPGGSTGTESSLDNELATQIAFLLNSMVASLDAACAGHQNLLEGFLFVLLSRVGKLLSLFAFQDLQLRPDLYADPGKLPIPAGLDGFDLNDQAQCAAKMEARHVIWLLERALAVVDSFRSSSSTSASQKDGENGIFTKKIKKKLQSTLLQAVFGESPQWKNALQTLSQPDQKDLDRLLSNSPVSEKDTSDWFIQETWRLLGWEMLEKKAV